VTVSVEIGKLADLYRDLHSHPELSWHETRTAGIAADRLRATGFATTEGLGGTSVAAAQTWLRLGRVSPNSALCGAPPGSSPGSVLLVARTHRYELLVGLATRRPNAARDEQELGDTP
jgi:hypothetical protein